MSNTYNIYHFNCLAILCCVVLLNSIQIYGIYETPEQRFLPPYFGCFHTSLYSNLSFELQGTHFDFSPSGILPIGCINFCLRNLTQGFEIASIKGNYCICSKISDRKDLNTTIHKVSDKYCTVCPGQHERIKIENKYYLNEFCGGNIPYSIYCVTDTNKINQTNPKIKFCNNLWISNKNEENLYKNDYKNLIDINFDMKCTLCINHSIICPTIWIKDKQQYIQQSSIYTTATAAPEYKINFEYLPINSPLSCINYCKQILPTTNKTTNFIAILGNSTKHKIGTSVDTCFCTQLINIYIDGFKKVENDKCIKKCPGDGSHSCGENQYKENGLIEQYFMMFEIFESDKITMLPTTTEFITSPFISSVETSTMIKTTQRVTLTPVETSTIIKTTQQKVTLTPRISDNCTTFNTELETESTIVSSTVSTVTTEIPSSTTKPSSTKSTSTKLPTTTTDNCPIKCVATDIYRQNWTACAGTIQEKKCFGNSNGTATWKCQTNGKFQGKTNVTDCETHWIRNIEDEITKEHDLTFEKAMIFLKLIEEKCMNASKPEYDYDSIYFGHEISILMGLGVKIMDILNGSNINYFENLTSQITLIIDEILDYDSIWNELTQKEKSETGEQLILTIEHSSFILSSKVVENEQDTYHYSPANTENKFISESGVILKENIKDNVIIFPRLYKPGESYIQLPTNLNFINDDEDDEVEFIGFQLNIKDATKLFEPDGHLIDDCNDDDICNHIINTILNAPLLSFSFGDKYNKTNTKFPENGIQITFEHDVTAWGTGDRPIRRKLHEGERRKAIQQTAACMYWDINFKNWSSEGCKIIESKQSQTICECNHLTSFALLMDIHNYEGKEYCLEILTLVLSPISILCLITSIILFIRIKEIQGPRTTITNNLCFCLLIGMILVITVMDRNYIWLSDDLCMVTAMIVHYIFLCGFAWMGLEGLLLYRLVILVFDTQRHYMNIQKGLAYGIPLLIVGITYSISVFKKESAYGGDEFCWLEDKYKLAFMVPIAMITMMNFIILIITMKKVYELQHSTIAKGGLKQKKSILSWIRGCFGITVLLGGTWIFGFLMSIHNPTISRIGAYLFTIFNASQGIFLFLFNCILNKKVRNSLGGHLPSWVSSTFTTRTNSFSSKLKFTKKTDVASISDDSAWSRRGSPENLIEQIGRRELIPDY